MKSSKFNFSLTHLFVFVTISAFATALGLYLPMALIGGLFANVLGIVAALFVTYLLKRPTDGIHGPYPEEEIDPYEE